MTQHRYALHWVRTALLGLYWIMLFVGTHLPGRYVPQELGSDKLMHFAAFAGLSFLLAWVIAPLRPTRRALLWTLLIAIAYASFDEWSQSMVANRTSCIRDWVADVAGTVVGLCAYMVTWVFANGLLSGWLRGARMAASREAP